MPFNFCSIYMILGYTHHVLQEDQLDTWKQLITWKAGTSGGSCDYRQRKGCSEHMVGDDVPSNIELPQTHS